MNRTNFITNFKIVITIFLFVVESFLFKLDDMTGLGITIPLMITNIFYVFFLLFYRCNNSDKKLNIIIFVSFLIRNVTLIFDLKGYNVGFNGGDSDHFYLGAIGQIDFQNHYVSLLEILFAMMGESRAVAQYFNIIASVFSLVIFKKTLQLICTNYKQVLVSLFIFSFAPANMLVSSALLREPIMILCNCISLFCFIKWYKENNIKYFLISFLFIFISAYFHSGMLLAVLGYAIAIVIYSHEHKKIIIYKQTLFSLFLLIVAFWGTYHLFGGSVTTYFDRIEHLEDLSGKFNAGSTDYLMFTNNLDSKALVILYTPLKILYFYLSPMIWDCRTFNVLLVCLFSSSIYFFLFFNIFKYKSYDKNLKIILLVVLFLLSFTYGWGCSNSGQAMRHREKVLPFVIVLYAIKYRKYDLIKNNN